MTLFQLFQQPTVRCLSSIKLCDQMRMYTKRLALGHREIGHTVPELKLHKLHSGLLEVGKG